MNFFKQYLNVINYSIMGLVFIFSGFYILLNGYHYLEVRKDFITSFKTQPLVVDIEDKLNNISQNTLAVDVNSYRGRISNNQMNVIKNNILSCVELFHNDTYTSMLEKDKITIIDVYKLREAYENTVLSKCIVNNLFWTTTVDSEFGSNYLLTNKEITKLYVNNLINNTSYLKKDLLNNSSYYFNTAISSASVKDNTRDGFYEVMSAYNDAAYFLEYVSNWYKNEVEGNL